MNYNSGIVIRNPIASFNLIIDTLDYEESWAKKRKDELICQILKKYRYWNRVIKLPIHIVSILLIIALSFCPQYFMDFKQMIPLQMFASAFLSFQAIRISIVLISDWIVLKPKHKGKRLSTLYF